MVTEESVRSGGDTKSSSGKDDGVRGFADGSVGNVGDGNSMEGSEKMFGQTYKRRKFGSSSSENRSSQSEKLSSASTVPLEDKIIKKFRDIGIGKTCGQGCDPVMNGHSSLNHSSDGSHRHWRNTLEMLCESLSSDEGGAGGIQGCIRDALVNDRLAGSTTEGDCHEDQPRSQSESVFNGSLSAAEGPAMVTSHGSSSEFTHLIFTKQCQQAFSKLILSQKFASLCKLLSENFHGVNVDKVLDLSLINSRMKGGAYEKTPTLFSHDIQQFWKKLNVIGSEMVSLAKSLSELSMLFCREAAGGLEHGTSSDKKDEFAADSEWHTRPEQTYASVYTAGTCGCCGQKSDGRDCLVCDSCEEMYHISCIEPAVKEIPHKNWYCSSCTRLGVELLHEDCVVCERLNASVGTDEDGFGMVHDESLDQLEQSSGIRDSVLQVYKGSQKIWCNVCKNPVLNGEVIRTCEHRFCHKHYHMRCLTIKQFKKYSSHWYGPCCLCRVCLLDRDDGKIVLCDACDYAYHMYCLNPPLATLPTGKWFCKKCAAGIQAIREARSLYENLGEKPKKAAGAGAGAGPGQGPGPGPGRRRVCAGFHRKKTMERSGGVEMLLTAANTLNYQEELAARYSRVKR
ncbi:hypothetical protein Dimus_024218 [Dionaea muscipula]